jgi:hypothetical protein
VVGREGVVREELLGLDEFYGRGQRWDVVQQAEQPENQPVQKNSEAVGPDRTQCDILIRQEQIVVLEPGCSLRED